MPSTPSAIRKFCKTRNNRNGGANLAIKGEASDLARLVTNRLYNIMRWKNLCNIKICAVINKEKRMFA